MITQSLFRQIKDPKHPLHYLLLPVKVSDSQMVLRPIYPYQIPQFSTGHNFVLWKELRYRIAFQSFSSAAKSACLGLFYSRVFYSYID